MISAFRMGPGPARMGPSGTRGVLPQDITGPYELFFLKK